MLKLIYTIALFLIFTNLSWTQNITEVILNFTDMDGNMISATAVENAGDFQVNQTIELMESTEYTLQVTLKDGDTDITNQVNDNGNNYKMFYQDSLNVFVGGINYQDMDNNELPIGLLIFWTTNCVDEGSFEGPFRTVLEDLTGVKTENSMLGDGTPIFDITWTIVLQDDPEAPPCENEEEIIDKVTLTFTPTAGGDAIEVIASDPDGPGPQDLIVEDITLMESTDYELSIKLENTIEGEDITEEIMEEDQDHLFLFAFAEDLFEDPDGDGNIDNRADPVNYNDMDENQLPVGLSTNWTTACTAEGSVMDMFRVVLKHQPGIKSESSGFEDGGTDLDITWNVTILDDPNAPACENEEEIIDQITLTFTPTAGGDAIEAIASDPDGPGPQDLVVEDIILIENSEYELSIKIENTIEGEDITEEIREEDQDHQFYFAWTENIFSDPKGDGNIDNSADPVNYNDPDENGFPVGLSTNWTTTSSMDNGTFRLVLKHQPGIKSATSTVDDGGTDIDITWNIKSIMTSLDNLSHNEKLVIAPNPVLNELRLLTEGINLYSANIEVYNSMGVMVKRLNQYSGVSGYVLQINDLAPGQYYLSITGDLWYATRKFVKL